MSSKLIHQAGMILTLVFFLILVPAILFQLRWLAFTGGDSGEMVNRLDYPWQFFMRAPLVIILNKALWLLLQWHGWRPEACIALSSCLAGGVYFLSLWILTRNPWVWAICFFTKVTFIFTGHIENYAWPYALSLLCFALLKLHREGRVSSMLVWCTAGVTFFFHPMTLMIWPGLAWGLERWNKPRIVEIILVSVLVGAVFDFFLIVGNVDGFFTRAWFLTLGAGQLCPYSILSWEHWQLLLGFHFFTLPIGLILFVWNWKRLQPGWQQGIGLAAMIALVWSAFWCPSKGPEDWDLFAFPAVFMNLAGGVGFMLAHDQDRSNSLREKSQAHSDIDR